MGSSPILSEAGKVLQDDNSTPAEKTQAALILGQHGRDHQTGQAGKTEFGSRTPDLAKFGIFRPPGS